VRLQLDSTSTSVNAALSGTAGSASPLAPSGVSSLSQADRAGPPIPKDSISISGPSSAISALTGSRAARISQLSAAVRGGSYQVDSNSISHAIVSYAGLKPA